MKKLFKFAAGVAAIAGAACGAVYCLKKFCGIDLLKRDEDFDDFDEEFDDDFDDDLMMKTKMTMKQKTLSRQMMMKQVTGNM